ncbi:hypothetical protein [Maribrevibacterium harenarium]|uniref:hypothetical protein n=1 Tax=Maribrevibacterium harenarium TaxID=2589817 RepID=UPI0015E3AF57|nr:hypothetical protein [Maribrevibacterium harenarium]
MKLFSTLLVVLAAFGAYRWWLHNPFTTIVMPTEQQRHEMVGRANTPSVPLNPL